MSKITHTIHNLDDLKRFIEINPLLDPIEITMDELVDAINTSIHQCLISKVDYSVLNKRQIVQTNFHIKQIKINKQDALWHAKEANIPFNALVDTYIVVRRDVDDIIARLTSDIHIIGLEANAFKNTHNK